MGAIQQVMMSLRAVAVNTNQQQYTTPGTYTWIAPTGVTSVCAVCVGSGGVVDANENGSREGGGLGWANNISVSPGNSYTVVVGGPGIASYFINTSIVFGGSSGSNTGSTFFGEGGGNGGGAAGGGGGAGGYTGNGGDGAGADGQGGGGAGGRTGGGTGNEFDLRYTAPGGGGGVGLFGIGASGLAGSTVGKGGGGGSGGAAGGQGQFDFPENNPQMGTGGSYGGGGHNSVNGNGAVRIIWGLGRSFPSNAA